MRSPTFCRRRTFSTLHNFLHKCLPDGKKENLKCKSSDFQSWTFCAFVEARVHVFKFSYSIEPPTRKVSSSCFICLQLSSNVLSTTMTLTIIRRSDVGLRSSDSRSTRNRTRKTNYNFFLDDFTTFVLRHQKNVILPIDNYGTVKQIQLKMF